VVSIRWGRGLGGGKEEGVVKGESEGKKEGWDYRITAYG